MGSYKSDSGGGSGRVVNWDFYDEYHEGPGSGGGPAEARRPCLHVRTASLWTAYTWCRLHSLDREEHSDSRLSIGLQENILRQYLTLRNVYDSERVFRRSFNRGVSLTPTQTGRNVVMPSAPK